jgi:DNA-directed RNA polymerase subunit RPC12/RpoP
MHKSELENHMTEVHALAVCGKCGLEFEARFLDSHPCRGEEIICEYCSGHFPKTFFNEHVTQCMNRTERCERCFQYIRLVEFMKHVEEKNCEDYYEKLKRLENEAEMKKKELEERTKPDIRPYLEDRKMRSRKKREEFDRKKKMDPACRDNEVKADEAARKRQE